MTINIFYDKWLIFESVAYFFEIYLKKITWDVINISSNSDHESYATT